MGSYNCSLCQLDNNWDDNMVVYAALRGDNICVRNLTLSRTHVLGVLVRNIRGVLHDLGPFLGAHPTPHTFRSHVPFLHVYHGAHDRVLSRDVRDSSRILVDGAEHTHDAAPFDVQPDVHHYHNTLSSTNLQHRLSYYVFSSRASRHDFSRFCSNVRSYVCLCAMACEIVFRLFQYLVVNHQ